MKSGFSIEFSAIRSPNRVLTTLFRISSFVPPSKIFVWEPCGKQHFREIPTPDFVRTLRPYPILNGMLDSYICLQNPAWVFRGNVVSHMVWEG
jgi:hypothetical protein